MTPQAFFDPGELDAIVDLWRLKAGGLFAVSLHDKGYLPGLDMSNMENALESVSNELEDYLSRYNAALIQDGESPVDLETLIASVTDGGLVKMNP